MSDHEGMLDVPGGRVWYRSLGDDGVPILMLHGGPGFPSDYMEPLAGLAANRRVIFYDQLGCGRSPAPDDPALWTVERFMDELDAVRDGLRLDQVHLLGSSWGGMLAMQYLLDRDRPPVALITTGSPASSPRWNQMAARLLSELDPADLAEIERVEAAGIVEGPELDAAVRPFYQRHVCRMDPWPDGLLRSDAAANRAMYRYMAGPSEFRIVGTLRDWDIMDRLSEISVPALITGGEFDECQPEHLQEVHERIPGSELRVIPDASHLCFAERTDVYIALVEDFLDRVEATAGIG
jgi:proline iminopeptidase